MKTLKNNITAAGTRINAATAAIKQRLSSRNGSFVVDHAVVFVIIIVLGALALVLLKDYLSNTLAPLLISKISEFFN